MLPNVFITQKLKQSLIISIVLYAYIFQLQIFYSNCLVSSPPKIIKQPPADELWYKEGQSLHLECEATGVPAPIYFWYKNRVLFNCTDFSNRISQQPGNGTLVIKFPKIEDIGQYQCYAYSEMGIATSNSVFLRALSGKISQKSENLPNNAKPYFTTEPKIQNKAERETVEFHCEVGGKPTPEIKWIHNGKPIETVEYNSRRTVTNNSLTISDLHVCDTGNYGCNATNKYGYVYKDVYVNVGPQPPYLITKPENMVTSYGTSVNLSCSADGVPKPIFKWTKNNQEITESRFKVNENGDLSIENSTFEDAGSFTCYAINGLGIDSVSATLAVKQRTKITRPPVEDIETKIGTDIEFKCKATTDPTTRSLQIDWLKDDKPISNAEKRYKISQNSLTIEKTIKKDSGVYTCLAKTDYDSDTASGTLLVDTVPTKINKATTVSRRRREVTIQWNKTEASKESPVLNYIVEGNTSFTPDNWDIIAENVPPTDNSLLMTLSPWANYTFRVIAINRIGQSEPSAPSDVILTSPDVPFKNPENVKGDGKSATDIIISWTPMPQIDHNAPNFKYKVYWKREEARLKTKRDTVESAWNVVEITDWRQTQILIPNQPTYQAYILKVKAENEKGDSTAALIEYRGFSGEDVPIESPSNLSLTKMFDNQTAILSWSAVSEESLRGKFEGYKIETWTDKSLNKRRKILFKSYVTEAVVDNLIPYTKNYFVVMACNSKYTGPHSKKLTILTPESKPGPIQTIKGYPLGANALYLQWEKPEHPNGKLTGYSLFCQKIEDSNKFGPLMQRSPNIQDPEITTAKVAGLEPGQRYRAYVKAINAKGTGEWGNYTEIATEEALLSTPKLEKPIFTWIYNKTEKDDVSIRFNWLPNFKGPGRPGSDFYARCRVEDGSQNYYTSVEIHELFVTLFGLDSMTTYVCEVVSVDGMLSIVSDSQIIGQTDTSYILGWILGFTVVTSFLLFVMLLMCIVKRQRGGKFSWKEIAQDTLINKDSSSTSFQMSHANEENPKSRSEVTLNVCSSDTDSVFTFAWQGEYSEDGSFLGEYGA